MADQHRRVHKDHYRRGSRSWSDRARDEARPWLRDDERWRQGRGSRATQAGYRPSGEGTSVSDGRGDHSERTPRFGDSHGQWGRQSFVGLGPKGYHRSDERIKEHMEGIVECSGQNRSGTHSSASQASGSSKATKPTNSAA